MCCQKDRIVETGRDHCESLVQTLSKVVSAKQIAQDLLHLRFEHVQGWRLYRPLCDTFQYLKKFSQITEVFLCLSGIWNKILEYDQHYSLKMSRKASFHILYGKAHAQKVKTSSYSDGIGEKSAIFAMYSWSLK